jgi:tetratricopeptide (TPR) repeat protein
MTERKVEARSWVSAVVTLVVLLGAWASEAKQTTPGDTATADKHLQASFEHYNAGRYDEAITAAKAALAANPNMADAYNNMAVSYLGLRRFDEGIQAARDAIRLKPDFQLAQNNLAWIQREQASAANPPVPPTPAETLLTDSLRHAQAGRFTECVESAKQSAKLDPTSTGAFNNAGFCAGNLKLWDEALKDMREAIRLDPNNQLAKNNLAWIEQQKALSK